jgi:hypothetical protein
MAKVKAGLLPHTVASIAALISASTKFRDFIEPAYALKQEVQQRAEEYSAKLKLVDSKIIELYVAKTGVRVSEVDYAAADRVLDEDGRSLVREARELPEMDVEIIRWVSVSAEEIDKLLATGRAHGGHVALIMPLLRVDGSKQPELLEG